jgi:hypothetical protein
MRALKIHKQVITPSFLTTVFFFFAGFSFSQPGATQRTLSVTPVQAINFGAFCVTGNSGGTITVGWDGSRTASGSIVLLATEPIAQPAVFEVKPGQGRNVIISYPVTTTLTGSNGASFSLDIGPTEKGVNGARFTVNSNSFFSATLRVGGTLHIPGKVQPGIYKGYFDVTFNQE